MFVDTIITADSRNAMRTPFCAGFGVCGRKLRVSGVKLSCEA